MVTCGRLHSTRVFRPSDKVLSRHGYRKNDDRPFPLSDLPRLVSTSTLGVEWVPRETGESIPRIGGKRRWLTGYMCR